MTKKYQLGGKMLLPVEVPKTFKEAVNALRLVFHYNNLKDDVIAYLLEEHHQQMIDWKLNDVIEPLLDIWKDGFPAKPYNKMSAGELAREVYLLWSLDDEKYYQEDEDIRNMIWDDMLQLNGQDKPQPTKKIVQVLFSVEVEIPVDNPNNMTEGPGPCLHGFLEKDVNEMLSNVPGQLEVPWRNDVGSFKLHSVQEKAAK